MDETTGLRERKKAQTRSAISTAVMLLALDRGLDAVTVDDIAAAANVSVRTFHNYFGSKEEALIAAWRSEFEVHLDELRARPADEPILVSLEHVLAGIARTDRRASPGRGHPERPALDEHRHGAPPVRPARRGRPHGHRRRRRQDRHRCRDRHLPPPRDRRGDHGDRDRLRVRAATCSPGEQGPEHFIHESFALLRAGLERTEPGP